MLKLEKPTNLPPAEIARKTTTFRGRTMYAVELNNQNVTFQTISEAVVVEPEECNSTSLWTRSIEESMVCATVLNGKCISKCAGCFVGPMMKHGVWSGDTGSPLFLRLNAKDDSPMVFVGIASFGNEACLRYQFPVVYTAMADYAPWIDSVVSGNVTVSLRTALPHTQDKTVLQSSDDEEQKAEAKRANVRYLMPRSRRFYLGFVHFRHSEKNS